MMMLVTRWSTQCGGSWGGAGR